MQGRVGLAVLLFGAYVAAMVVAASLLPHEWDWRFGDWLGSRAAPAFSPDVSIADISAWDPNDKPADRRLVADFLNGLVHSDRRPKAVILDITFGQCGEGRHCDARWTAASAALAASIRGAVQHYITVYGTEEIEPQELTIKGNEETVWGLDPQEASIYAAVSGSAQTKFTTIANPPGDFYQLCYPDVALLSDSGALQGNENVWSMVIRALMSPKRFAQSPPCDADHVQVRLGSRLALAPPAVYEFSHSSNFPGYAQFDSDSYVIVGTMTYDQPPDVDRPGPELLGWALSDALENNVLDQESSSGQHSFYDVQPQNSALLLLVPTFSLVALLAYFFGFFQLKKMRGLGIARRFVPWIPSAIAVAAGLGGFALFEAWMFANHHIQPQVTLVSLGVILASGLSGIYGREIILDEESAIELGETPALDYDVFISYAHEEGAWVSQNVYEPLKSATYGEGKELKIFFDTTSIPGGRAWQTRITLALDASRFIVPVYSDLYFSRPYCRFEILRAHRKWINAGDDPDCVLPVMRGHPKIYRPVDDIQAKCIDDIPDLVQQYVNQIVETLNRESHAGPGPEPSPS